MVALTTPLPPPPPPSPPSTSHRCKKAVPYFRGALLSGYGLACKGIGQASLQTWPTVSRLYLPTINLVESCYQSKSESWASPMLRSPDCKFASHAVLIYLSINHTTTMQQGQQQQHWPDFSKNFYYFLYLTELPFWQLNCAQLSPTEPHRSLC